MQITDRLFNIQNRKIIVAGGAGQIGFALVTVLADAGATVIIADIDAEMAASKIERLEDADLKKNIFIYQLDVSNKESINKFYNNLSKQSRAIDGLVNCFHFKGDTRKLDKTSDFFADFGTYSEEAWNLVHDVNLKGTFLMSQGVLPFMKKNARGVIVNISSTYGNVSPNKNIYGDSGINSPVAYASSKGAIINLTRYMATHLAPLNIRVNTLSPGGVYNNQSEEFVKNYSALTPLQRMAQAEDYQGAIIFLISDASTYMTGANLIIDGGWTAW